MAQRTCPGTTIDNVKEMDKNQNKPPGFSVGAENDMVNNFLKEHQATDDVKKLPDILSKPVISVNKTTLQPPKKPEEQILPPILAAQEDDDDIARIGKQKPAHEDISIWDRVRAKEKNGPNGKSNKFRTLARMIKTNLQWTKDMQEKTNEDERSDAFTVKCRNKGGAETLTFDANQYKVKDRSYGGLTASSRRILLKHPLERTREELVVLVDVVDRLKCFMKYPAKVKYDMARVIFYEHFEDGRIIIQQGHIGQSFYFIVSGKVEVTTTKVDKLTGHRQLQVLGELTEGSTFGELALLHNIKRTATIICKGDAEFLRVDKQDFEAVLRSSYEREWNERLKALGWMEAFKNWTPLELANFNNYCKLKEVQRDKMIHGNTNEAPDNIYFVISGECRIVRTIYLVKEILEFNRIVYHFPSKSQLESYRNMRKPGQRRGGAMKIAMPEARYWTIGTLTKGFYFGVGEDLTDTYIIAKTNVELLVVPRVQFKQGRARILERMTEDLQALMPSNKDLYKRYSAECHWQKYKKDVTAEIVHKNSIPNATKLTDVPMAIRSERGYSLIEESRGGSPCKLAPCEI